MGEMEMHAHVEKLLVGQVKKSGNKNAPHPMDREWESGIFKKSVKDQRWLSKLGLAGDEVGDTKNHGGVEKALFAYSTEHYHYWQEQLDLKGIAIGAMGENIAVKGMDEQNVCIGDTYQLGDAIIQVSQPRQPCWKPARRFRKVDFALHIQQSGRTGWYFRVLKEGFVQRGQELQLLERPYPHWSIAKCNEVMHVKKEDLALAKELASCNLLAENWRKTLMKRLAGKESTIHKRVYGPNKD